MGWAVAAHLSTGDTQLQGAPQESPKYFQSLHTHLELVLPFLSLFCPRTITLSFLLHSQPQTTSISLQVGCSHTEIRNLRILLLLFIFRNLYGSQPTAREHTCAHPEDNKSSYKNSPSAEAPLPALCSWWPSTGDGSPLLRTASGITHIRGWVWSKAWNPFTDDGNKLLLISTFPLM